MRQQRLYAEQLVRTVLASRGDVDEADLTDEATLDQLGVDSIDLAMIFAEAERRFEVDFENDEVSLQRYATLQDLIQTLEDRIGAETRDEA